MRVISEFAISLDWNLLNQIGLNLNSERGLYYYFYVIISYVIISMLLFFMLLFLCYYFYVISIIFMFIMSFSQQYLLKTGQFYVYFGILKAFNNTNMDSVQGRNVLDCKI